MIQERLSNEATDLVSVKTDGGITPMLAGDTFTSGAVILRELLSLDGEPCGSIRSGLEGEVGTIQQHQISAAVSSSY